MLIMWSPSSFCATASAQFRLVLVRCAFNQFFVLFSQAFLQLCPIYQDIFYVFSVSHHPILRAFIIFCHWLGNTMQSLRWMWHTMLQYNTYNPSRNSKKYDASVTQWYPLITNWVQHRRQQKNGYSWTMPWFGRLGRLGLTVPRCISLATLSLAILALLWSLNPHASVTSCAAG